MALNWHQCENCKIIIKKASKANVFGCPKGKFGEHKWWDLGEVGETNWNCEACGIVIQTKSMPNPLWCVNGKYFKHTWWEL